MQSIQGFFLLALLAVVAANQSHFSKKQINYVDYMEEKVANETGQKLNYVDYMEKKVANETVQKLQIIGNSSELQIIAKKEKRGNIINLL